jgi:hypothetical protein
MGEQLPEVARPADRHADVPHRVLDDQVPPDDPGHQFAQRGVGIGICRPADRHHGGELRVAERGESAGDGREQEREHDGGSRAQADAVAYDGGPGGGEDPRADGGADAKRGQVPLAERAPEPAPFHDVVLAILHGLPEEQPAHQGTSVGVWEMRVRSCCGCQPDPERSEGLGSGSG